MLALLKGFRFVLRSVLKFSGFICTKADAQKDGRFVATTILDYLCLRDFGAAWLKFVIWRFGWIGWRYRGDQLYDGAICR